MNYYSIIKEAENYVTGIFSRVTDKELLYHNLLHTQQVVANTAKIATFYKLDEKDYSTVILAAWFHDVGYYLGNATGHEAIGAETAASFLKDKEIPYETVEAIKNCILATKMPQSPKNLLEQIVCDADLFPLGTDDFDKRNKLMRKETEWRLGKKIPKSEWRKGTIALLESHHFHTDYARKMLQDKKSENLDKLKRKSSEVEKEEEDEIPLEDNIAKEGKNDLQETASTNSKKLKSDRPDRGIETMFRITSGNNQRLSDMADNKAHIMITTTSIIISVLLSVLIRKLEENPNLIIPTILLLLVCVITMVFSILATRPSIPNGTFTKQEIAEKKTNLLFFGNFYRMNFDEYFDGMQEMMNSRDFLYGSLIRDIYSQGVVLGRKYRLLRIAYDIFMFGIVVSVMAFVISSIFYGR